MKKKTISIILAAVMLITFWPISPLVTHANLNELNEALNYPGGTLSFVNDSVHPWKPDGRFLPDRTAGGSGNSGAPDSSSTITLNAGTLAKNKVLTFDWHVSSEADKDTLYFIVNGAPYAMISGLSGQWETIDYVVPSTGTYTFKWTFEKDYVVNSGADKGWVSNVRIRDYVHVNSVVVTPIIAPVYIGFTTQFQVQVFPEDAINKKVTWYSDNTNIATVDANGLVKGVAQGSAYISAVSQDGGIAGEGRVDVQPPVPTTGISLDAVKGTLLVGDTGTLTPTLYPEYASYRTVSWFTSDSVIATVNTAGVVKGVNAGTAWITAQTETGGFDDSCQVTVVEESSLSDHTSLTYTPININSDTPVKLGWLSSKYIKYERHPLITTTSARGFSVQLQEGIKIKIETNDPKNVDTYLDLYDADFNRLAYDDDSGRASFSLIDNFVVPHTGTYYILVSGYSYTSTSKGSFNLSVTEIPPVPVEGVNILTETFTVPLGYTLPLPYAVLPSNADEPEVTFSSSNPEHITVNSDGEVTAVTPGSSVITVTTVQGGFTDSCVVSVGYTAVTDIDFDTDAVIVGLNDTKTLQYEILPAEAQLRGVSFTSSNPAVATVDSQGIVTALSIGNAVITVTTNDGGKTDTCSVMVVDVNISTCASVTLVAGDVWGDGTGYQMLIDADADAYGRLFQKSGPLNMEGDAPAWVYDEFEYKIPENADGALNTSNIVFNNAITILIPAGVYDYCITNPLPGKKVWIADTNATSPGRYNNFHFQAGYSYVFTITNNGSPIPTFKRDVTTLTSSYTGAGLSKYNVSFSVAGIGGQLNGKNQILVEEDYILTSADLPAPVADYGYHFTGWDVSPVGTTVQSDIGFTASFEINKYAVIFKDWNGTTLKVQENVVHGTAATAPPAPNTRPNWHFVGWSPSFDNVTGNLVVIAQYAIDSYAVNLPSGEGYSVHVHGDSVNPVPRGGNFSFTVELEPDYSDSAITVKANGVTITPEAGIYTITNVTEVKNVTVTGVRLNLADYTALDAAIALTLPHPDAFYTAETLNAFRGAQQAGAGVDRNLNLYSQHIVDAAEQVILSAYGDLELRPASYELLDAAIHQELPYNEVYYTADSFAAYQAAVAAGLAVSRDLLITDQNIVDAAWENILTARNNLVLRPEETQFILKASSPLSLDRGTGIIAGLTFQTNGVSSILSQFQNNAIITVTDLEGNILEADDVAGTGALVNLLNKDGTAVDTIAVFIYGDVDGNGAPDAMDAVLIRLIANGMLTGQENTLGYLAADVNRDGQINEADAALLEQAGVFAVSL
ncbi:MAG: Ig-like domain-containing protein [Acutalibacteraceae bacterium]|jgi:uncharacterized protein YjdB